MVNDDPLRFPVGRFELPAGPLAPTRVEAAVAEIEALPRALRAAVAGLGEAQIDTPYRPGGWTVRQVVHHVGDSHMHAFLRFKWALTEARPAILAYDEAACARLADALLPVEVSLALLDALHARWTAVMRALEPAEWARVFVHPEGGPTRLDHAAATYAWHGRHHLAHVRLVSGRPEVGLPASGRRARDG